MSGPAWRYILHADLDAFYASVEQLDEPSLRGKPVVVGGSPEGRGVVAAASYEARKYGVHSAMPMRTAMRLCPALVRVSPRFGRYREASDQVFSLLRELSPVIEPLSMDEAYIDVSEQVQPGGLTAAAERLRARVRRETGLVVTVGGGTSKTVAKVASQVAKPDGLLLVPPGEEAGFLAPLDVRLVPGVGPKTAVLLAGREIATVGGLAACDEGWLLRALGRRGPDLRRRALGVDDSPVAPHRETKSVSAETTMVLDTGDEADLEYLLDGLARSVGERMRRHELLGRTVYVKLRLSDFTSFTRQTTLPSATDDAEVVRRVAGALLRRELGPGRTFRLVGVGVTNFEEEERQLPLLP